MNLDVAETKRMMRTRDELKAAIESGNTSPDLQKEVEALVKKVRKKRAEHEAIQNRIRRGLATNGKNLRRNATCPCGSGKKFKKCCLANMKAARNPRIESDTKDDGNHPKN